MKVLSSKSRFRLKQGRLPDDGGKGIGMVDLALLPNQCHLSCPECSSPWFGVSANGPTTKIGCKCGWESNITLPFTGGRCPACKCGFFALIKLGEEFAIGCKKCSWEEIVKVEKVSTGGLILPN